MKVLWIGLIALISLIGCEVLEETDITREADFMEEKRGTVFHEKTPLSLSSDEDVDKNVAEYDEENELYVVSNPDEVDVYVNKKRRLPEGYEPDDLVAPDVEHLSPEGDNRRLLREEAADALEDLFSEALDAGHNLIAVSGYRSEDRQRTLYNSYVEQHGQEEADRFSARPGTSEHQTGLAMDISAASVSFGLEEAFSGTNEGEWVKDNAHHFGYVIRYPEGKTDITGYVYEPWHLRYVGEELATHLYTESLTLEEYFGYHY
ncbi:D-Ala-D-Ala carboxypeptidase. Metallo peptidase. MEROPS family M15B [Pelagirhabdus alkalitolerans]|uniref:D-Ala-D-Ala carboxypeptidase. Metallo peptidase. MEROPS family M15B n=1 Tax=Pelagirhabdus alkalitolerans TaxID=1612202 RepID=A0A1G6N4A3_9BACI|nr:M15 family metallopeptidase [Pelagirhabdus alkalitolerans]SDC62669.1 D-Ala-D-Ala carboxypeptidase. Metallo peptidase. MEROPS family M15B [Pelagirhabdus alkalitolerans]